MTSSSCLLVMDCLNKFLIMKWFCGFKSIRPLTLWFAECCITLITAIYALLHSSSKEKLERAGEMVITKVFSILADVLNMTVDELKTMPNKKRMFDDTTVIVIFLGHEGIVGTGDEYTANKTGVDGETGRHIDQKPEKGVAEKDIVPLENAPACAAANNSAAGNETTAANQISANKEDAAGEPADKEIVANGDGVAGKAVVTGESENNRKGDIDMTAEKNA